MIPMKARQRHKRRAGGHNSRGFPPYWPRLPCIEEVRYLGISPKLGMSGCRDAHVIAGGAKQKGKNLMPEEEELYCRSFMYVSIDARRGIGQKKTTFWVVVAANHTINKPAVGPKRPARSLETIWRRASPSLWVAINISKPSMRAGEQTTTSS